MQVHQAQDLSLRFIELDALLTGHRSYWQLQAFAYLDLPWRQSEPELCLWLDNLAPAQVKAYVADRALLIQHLSLFLPKLGQIDSLAQFSALPEAEPPDKSRPVPPSRFSTHIKGRKWQQIQAFEAATAKVGHKKVLEWCAGKGHLGRLLAYKQQVAVSSVEWMAELCEHGQSLAKASSLPIHYVQADVLSGAADVLLKQHDSAVALHACGELHLHLMRQGAQAGIQYLAIAPCCYHLIPQPIYQPLCEPAQKSQLRLDHQDLKFPLQETVVAGARIQRLRQVELSWRLGFDCLQRTIRGQDTYLPVPSVAKQLLSGSFDEFCQWAAFAKQLELPKACCFDDYLRQGHARLAILEKIELVQQVFKAAVEAWLILDRALFLQEQAYDLEMGTFCERELSPRNIMIRARKQC